MDYKTILPNLNHSKILYTILYCPTICGNIDAQCLCFSEVGFGLASSLMESGYHVAACGGEANQAQSEFSQHQIMPQVSMFHHVFCFVIF